MAVHDGYRIEPKVDASTNPESLRTSASGPATSDRETFESRSIIKLVSDEYHALFFVRAIDHRDQRAIGRSQHEVTIHTATKINVLVVRPRADQNHAAISDGVDGGLNGGEVIRHHDQLWGNSRLGSRDPSPVHHRHQEDGGGDSRDRGIAARR